MSRPRRRARPRAAQTLVEVLVAVVVCGAGLAVAATGVTASLRAEGRAADLERAARHLDLLLARLEGGALALADGEGDFDAEGAPDLTWTIVVRPGAVEGLRDAQVTVLWSRHGADRELTVVRSVFVDPLAPTTTSATSTMGGS